MDIWPIVTIVGPALLLAAILYAWWKNKQAPASNYREAERGAKHLQDEIATDPEHDDDARS